MPIPKHVHVKRRKANGTWAFASKIQSKVKRQLQAVLAIGSALRGRAG